MEFKLRRAKSSDLPAIIQLNDAMCRDEYRRYDPLINPDFAVSPTGLKYYRSQLRKTSSLLQVATIDNQVVGYLSAVLSDSETYRQKFIIAELADMAIHKDFRRAGLGRALAASFKKWAAAHKAKVIRVVASAGNLKACNFYKKNGFKPMSVTFESVL